MKFDTTPRGRAYHSWYNMIQRCKGKAANSRYYTNIKVCDRWLDFEAFIKDMNLPDENNRTLERINNDGDYTPENCRWASWKDQGQNRRTTRLITINGETKSVSQWIDSVNFKGHKQTLRQYLGTRGENAFIERIKSLQVTS